MLNKTEIEYLAISIFKKILNIESNFVINYENLIRNNKNIEFIQALTNINLNDYYTPDAIISNSFKEDNLEDLLFVDINEPEGSLLSESGIEIAQYIQKEINSLKVNEYKNISLKSDSIKNYILSKLNKINNKYALNRDKKGLVSFNNGIIFIINPVRNKEINEGFNFNLSHLQWDLLLKDTLETISDGKCNFSDIKQLYLNQFVSFNFVEEYKNISFILFIGNEVAENYNYFIINDYFLVNSKNIVSQILKQKRIGNGNIFRNFSMKEKIIIEIENKELKEDSIIYPYGYKDYIGNYKGNV